MGPMRTPVRRRRTLSHILILRSLVDLALMILRAVYVVIHYAFHKTNNDAAAVLPSPRSEPARLTGAALVARATGRAGARCKGLGAPDSAGGRGASSGTHEAFAALPAPSWEEASVARDASARRMLWKMFGIRDPGEDKRHFWFYTRSSYYSAMLCAKQLVLMGSLGTAKAKSQYRMNFRLLVEDNKWVRIGGHFIPEDELRETLVVLKIRRSRRLCGRKLSLSGRRYVLEVLHFLRDALTDGCDVYG